MKILRLSLLFSQIVSIIAIVILYLFSVAVFQPEVYYPKHSHRTLFLDRNLNEDEVMFITRAALEWTERTKHVIEFDVVTLPNPDAVVTPNDIVLVSISQDHPDIILLDKENDAETLGFFDPNSRIPLIYLVSTRLTYINYVAVVLHELGHAIGLEHNEDISGIGTLMYPTISLAAPYITAIDLHNFCKLYHCNLK